MAEKKLTGAERFKLDLYFCLQTFVPVLTALILTFTLVGRVIGVRGSSMYPTLRDGDLLLLQSLGYEPRPGDVVVLTKPFGHVDGPIVKRVVAVGGQTVEIDYDAGTVRVDGVALEEPYVKEVMRVPAFEHLDALTVPQGSVFVMGDNRNRSDDSRDVALGAVDRRLVLGRAFFVLVPAGGGRPGPIF